jgi:hypothetical protein
MFRKDQIKLLSGKLNEKFVKTRQHERKLLSYIEGWHAIAEANRIFGFDGWNRETVSAQCIWHEIKRDAKACTYTARVRIRVRAGGDLVTRREAASATAPGPPSAKRTRAPLRKPRPMPPSVPL